MADAFPSESSKGSPMQSKANLTREELKALQECNTESFWYRCVPLGVLFVGTTQILVNRGFIPANPRFGSLFKNMGAALLAYLVGKISYQGTCREKILRLENSPLAEAMRTGKRGTGLLQDISLPRTGFHDDSGHEAPPSGSDVHQAVVSDDHYQSGDIDTDQNVEYKGLDDTLRPSIDRDSSSIVRNQQNKESYTSYRDLQKVNRDEYDQKVAASQRAAMRDQGSPSAAPTRPYKQTPSRSDSSSIVRNQQNKESYTSYRDLQKVNRDEYDQKVAASQRAAMRDQGSPSAAPTRPYKQTPSRNVRRNQYGDIIED